jgi:hypothetical protein
MIRHYCDLCGVTEASPSLFVEVSFANLTKSGTAFLQVYKPEEWGSAPSARRDHADVCRSCQSKVLQSLLQKEGLTIKATTNGQ